MWTITAVTICLGIPAPDGANCAIADDTFGPYATIEECKARVEDIRKSWPIAVMLDSGWLGPVMMTTPECVKAGDPA